MAMNLAQRRYVRRLIPMSAAYVAAILLASSVLPKGASASPATIAIALIPGLAVLGVIWSIGRFLTELSDEYLRMLEIRKALVATGLTLSLASTWGILELYTDVSRVPIFWVFPVWCFGLGVGALVNKLTLSDAGCA